MVPDPSLVERFRADLDALIEPGTRFGVAVSGGPDSLALLLLAEAARPGEFEAATVDHGLRPESRSEAEQVARICERIGVPHAVLAIEWDLPPGSGIQEQARAVRYGALAQWMRERELTALLTGHHLDDQAETLLMRLNRGSGARGLAGMRRRSALPGDRDLSLLRPLLGWRQRELEEICEAAGLNPIADPSNTDERHERVRIRQALENADWLDPQSLVRSAEHLASADEALEWAANGEWAQFVDVGDEEIVYRASTAPPEILRRIVARAISELGTEGSPDELRGRELDRLITDLQACRTTTLRGVRCTGGIDWKFDRAPRRSN
ncbi:MAG: tRNA lysidine(34) synthetase TilS [Sphingomonas sp.]|nr:tRNA lysidine(34) synthetase TilS [Sphingomonas sp.]